MDESCEGSAMVTQARTVSLAEKLTGHQKDAEQKLADIKRAKEILKNNPELEELLTILGRTGRNLLSLFITLLRRGRDYLPLF